MPNSTAAKQLSDAKKQNAFYAFLMHFKAFGGEGWWEPEVVLAPPPARQFRYDARHADSRTLLEIQGGVWMAKGGHNTGQGIARDCEKANFAQYNGYAIILLTTHQIEGDDPADVFIPLVAFVNERAAQLKAIARAIDEPSQAIEGRVGVW